MNPSAGNRLTSDTSRSPSAAPEAARVGIPQGRSLGEALLLPGQSYGSRRNPRISYQAYHSGRFLGIGREEERRQRDPGRANPREAIASGAEWSGPASLRPGPGSRFLSLLDEDTLEEAQRFGDGPGLEGAAARRVRRLGLGNFGEMANPRLIEMRKQRLEKSLARLGDRSGGIPIAMDTHPSLDERAIR